MHHRALSIAATALVFGSTFACAAKPAPITQAATAQLRHFRITFLLTYPNTQEPSQSFALDVPVMPGRPGSAAMHLSAGPTGQLEGSTQQNIECTDVHLSTAGLATHVSFSIDRVPLKHLPGLDEPLHNQMNLERKVDLVLGKPTVITEMQQKPLAKPADTVSSAAPAPPQITVTAAEI